MLEVFQLQDLQSVISVDERLCFDQGMRYYHRSNGGVHYDQGHWWHPIIIEGKYFPFDMSETPMFWKHRDLKNIWNEIKSITGTNLKLNRVYINGYTYGTDGYAHYDHNQWGVYGETFIVYLNDQWEKDFAGETVVYEEDEIVKSVLPKLGRVFRFDSSLEHAARPLSRSCPELRRSLVFKTVDVVNDPMIEYLLNNTKDLQHSGGEFFEHLWGTMCYMQEDNDNEIDIIKASLFHSVYGTESYKFESNAFSREKVRELIGEYAEELVYEFCTLENRTASIIENTKNYSEKMHKDLLKLEYCNYLEQNADNKGDEVLSVISQML